MCSRRWPSCSRCVAPITSTITTRSGRGASAPLEKSAMRKLESYIAPLVTAVVLFCATASAQERLGIGRTATPAEIAGWNIDIGRDGSNLPPGNGSVARGRAVYAEQCAACHGAEGQGGLGDRLV